MKDIGFTPHVLDELSFADLLVTPSHRDYRRHPACRVANIGKRGTW